MASLVFDCLSELEVFLRDSLECFGLSVYCHSKSLRISGDTLYLGFRYYGVGCSSDACSVKIDRTLVDLVSKKVNVSSKSLFNYLSERYFIACSWVR